MDYEEEHLRILSKLIVVWNANPEESLFSLLANLCGGGVENYIVHTFRDGITDELAVRTFSTLGATDDDDLERALDGLIDKR